MARIPPHRRPLYPPTERMAILEVKAIHLWFPCYAESND